MSRRRLPLLLAVLGVVIIAAAIVAASVVRSSDTATLRLAERPEMPVVVTEPGVLDAVDPRVTVRATAEDDEPVVLAVGRTSEVEAWLGDAEHVRVTGLSSWEELTVEVVTGTAEPTAEPTEAAEEPTEAAPPDADPSALPDPAGSDLWVAETVDIGTAELTWTDTPGRWSLVAATDGTGPAPEVELEWGRQVSTPWLVPGIIVGAIVLVAGATMLVLDALARREQRRRDEARSRGADESRPTVSVTDTDPDGERLTRRQIREMERAMARADRSRRAGEPVPPIPLAGEENPDSAGPQDTETTTAGWFARSAQGDSDDADGRADEEAGSDPDADVGAAGPPSGPHAADETTDVDARDEEDGTDEGAQDTDGGAPGTLSWRSVWGFGGTPTPTDQDDEGKERR